MAVRELKPGDLCEFKNCKEVATWLVYDRGKEDVLKCCNYHADVVLEQDSPEYTEVCPNCECQQGVN